MRLRLFSQLLEWRWAPCAGLVLGSGAFVVLAVALIPDHFAEVAAPSARQLTLPAEPAPSPAQTMLGVPEPAEASDTSGAPSPSERHARRRQHRTLAASPPSPTSDPVASFFPEAAPEALPPPLPDTPPPPEPPAPAASTPH
jgi:hypothetical protein